ncbi:MAG: hypothetical protein JWO36_2208, partial [Myxococcales bacterium]|nr:hypothetical protein [Myxococcales bacterium]
VAGVSALSVVGLLAFRQLVPFSDLAGSTNEVGNYLQTVGGIYAVLLAFVVYVVWGQFNDARGYCDREAAALVDLHRTASGLPAATRDDIQKTLRNYLDAVVTDEWDAMARGDEATMERVGERLDHVWLAIHQCKPNSECQHTVYGEVLSRFNDLMDLRTSRLSSGRAHIPVAMKILLYTGAIIVIGSMYLLAFERVWIHALVTAALAGAIAHVLFLIVDLDDAFAGDWQVPKGAFIRARRQCERATHLMDADAS